MGSELGARGEAAAAAVYLADGYEIVASNWRCRVGELDLVLRRDDLLVICEVKTRSGTGFGAGWEAVTQRKQAKVRRVTEAFLAAFPAARRRRIRFDVASVDARPGVRPVVEVFADAF